MLDTAIKLYERAAVAVAVGNIALTFADQGLSAQAEQLFTRAIALAQALNTPYYLVGCALYGRAELYARREDYAAAKVSNDEALRIASEAECADIQPQSPDPIHRSARGVGPDRSVGGGNGV